MATDLGVDAEVLRREIKKTYASVSQEPQRDFVFPTGRAWAEDLDYPAELARVPEGAVESFAGVANPFSLGRLKPGEHVLDLGCGAGTDSLIAAQMVGSEDSRSVTGKRPLGKRIHRPQPHAGHAPKLLARQHESKRLTAPAARPRGTAWTLCQQRTSVRCHQREEA